MKSLANSTIEQARQGQVTANPVITTQALADHYESGGNYDGHPTLPNLEAPGLFLKRIESKAHVDSRLEFPDEQRFSKPKSPMFDSGRDRWQHMMQPQSIPSPTRNLQISPNGTARLMAPFSHPNIPQNNPLSSGLTANILTANGKNINNAPRRQGELSTRYYYHPVDLQHQNLQNSGAIPKTSQNRSHFKVYRDDLPVTGSIMNIKDHRIKTNTPNPLTQGNRENVPSRVEAKTSSFEAWKNQKYSNHQNDEKSGISVIQRQTLKNQQALTNERSAVMNRSQARSAIRPQPFCTLEFLSSSSFITHRKAISVEMKKLQKFMLKYVLLHPSSSQRPLRSCVARAHQLCRNQFLSAWAEWKRNNPSIHPPPTQNTDFIAHQLEYIAAEVSFKEFDPSVTARIGFATCVNLLLRTAMERQMAILKRWIEMWKTWADRKMKPGMEVWRFQNITVDLTRMQVQVTNASTSKSVGRESRLPPLQAGVTAKSNDSILKQDARLEHNKTETRRPNDSSPPPPREIQEKLDLVHEEAKKLNRQGEVSHLEAYLKELGKTWPSTARRQGRA